MPRITGLNTPMYPNYTLEDYENMRELLNVNPGDKAGFLNHVYDKSYKVDRYTSIANTAPVSLANRYALFTWYGLHGVPNGDISTYYRDMVNNPLTAPDFSRNPSTQKLIDIFNESYGGMEYAWSDFLWAKYHKRIANNHLLTLRRFATPVEDNIYDANRSVF
jgi:hypothetical protein